MITAILDTNIYGFFIADKDLGIELAEKIKNDSNLIIHNFKLIRNELRGAPATLTIYDRLVSNRSIEESKQIKDLAHKYFEYYKEIGGIQGQKKIINDFKIVACAALLNCDLVVSGDERTLLNPLAIKSYRYINLKINRRTPTFYRYNDLKRKYF
ncbi:hypothetical protein J4423_01405 [Candidatus Pacearchaeota archaeon]|nr:hypothetical protein [Candidatus Pacearchaeota archaeon]